MALRSENNFGDLLKALAWLKAHDRETVGRVAGMLGLEEYAVPLETVGEIIEEEIFSDSSPSVKDKPQPRKEKEKPRKDREETDDGSPVRDGADNEAWVEKIKSTAPRTPEWYASTQPLPKEEMPKTEPPLDSLLHPNWTRAILAATLTVPANDGVVDFEKLVEMIATKRSITNIPQKWKEHLNKGVHVVVDVNESMRPFALDQRQVVRSLEKLFPVDAIKVWPVVGCPLTERRWGALEFQEDYCPPPEGRPVLVITDFGMGFGPFGTRASTAREWYHFALRCKEKACPVTALTPVEMNRIQPRLRNVIAIIKWDRTTKSGHVKHIRAAVRKNI